MTVPVSVAAPPTRDPVASDGVPATEGVDHLLPDTPGIAGTKRRILAEAMRLFADRGFYGTSIRDIADAVGIRSASLYDHFRNKEEILLTIVTIGHDGHLAAMRAALEEAGADPVAAVRALVRTHIVTHCSFPLLAIVTNAELHALSPEQAAPVLALRTEAELLALDVAVRGHEQGVFRPLNLGATLAAIGSMGLRAPHWFVPSDDYGIEDLARDYGALALRMLGVDDDG
jgi:AcrR family transcriptional regulator